MWIVRQTCKDQNITFFFLLKQSLWLYHQNNWRYLRIFKKNQIFNLKRGRILRASPQGVMGEIVGNLLVKKEAHCQSKQRSNIVTSQHQLTGSELKHINHTLRHFRNVGLFSCRETSNWETVSWSLRELCSRLLQERSAKWHRFMSLVATRRQRTSWNLFASWSVK